MLCKDDYYANQLRLLRDLVDIEEVGRVIPTWVISACPNADRIVDFRQIRAWTYMFQTIMPILQSLVFGTQAEHLEAQLEIAEDTSALVLQVLRCSSSIFTSVYVAEQKLKKALARASLLQ
ncbi:hypothetical protein Tco_1109603 [Tanacetum coccineum]